MSDKPNYAARQAVALPFLVCACLWAEPYQYHPDTFVLVWLLWIFTTIIGLSCGLRIVIGSLKYAFNKLLRRVKNLKGSARWASKKDVKRSGMFDK